MTNNTNNRLTRKAIPFLIVLCILAFSMFFFTACGKKDEYKEKDYSVEYTDDSKITNGSFEFGTEGFKASDFPKSSSVSGWSVTSDNGASSSVVESGIVDTSSDEAWKALLGNLYGDSDFIAYAQKNWAFDKSEIENEIKNAHSEYSEDQLKTAVKNKIVDDYLFPNFKNPSTHSGANGSKVYMLNNYCNVKTVGNTGLGTAQKVSSSVSVTLEKGSYGKVTVYVKTMNLDSVSATNVGANIRIVGNVGSVSQTPYCITGIDTSSLDSADGWAKYEIFVKADDYASTSFNVILGLGFGNGSSEQTKDFVEGTVFFDDVVFEKIEKSDFDDANAYVFEYKSSVDEKHTVSSLNNAENKFYYSLNVSESFEKYADAYYTAKALSPVNGKFTVSSNSGKTGKFGEDSTASVSTFSPDEQDKCPYAPSGSYTKLTLTKASYSFDFGSASAPIAELPAESYYILVFYIKKDLGKFSPAVSVFVYDVFNNANETMRANSEITFDEENEWTRVEIKVSNNFPEKDSDGKYLGRRGFFLRVVVGPADVDNSNYEYQYATGTVTVSPAYIAKGSTYSYKRNAYKVVGNEGSFDSYDSALAQGNVKDYVVTADKTEYSDYYSYLSSNTTLSCALYSGYSEDFSDSSSTDSYSFTVSPSNAGMIISNPSDADGYSGIVSDHIYVKAGSNNAEINTRSGSGDSDGNIAGLINTKYLLNYSNGVFISDKLNYNGLKPIQPLMIYNANEDAYGFISEHKTMSANSTVAISLKVRIPDEQTKAFIYLVDVSKESKLPLSISVPVNTDGNNYLDAKDVFTKTNDLSFQLTSANTEADGWITVNFYIATGNKSVDYRIELWNGSRDGVTKSKGFVFFDNVNLTGSFTESSADNYREAFITDGVLKDARIKQSDIQNSALLYRRELATIEKKYNEDSARQNDPVSYKAKYVFVKGDTMIYAIYNTLPDYYDVTDPYDSEPSDEDAGSGCTAKSDPATFWLSFSTIILAVALAFAMIALIAKRVITKRKANKSDAKSYYKVKSKYSASKANKSAKKEKREQSASDDDKPDESVSEEKDEAQDSSTEEIASENTEQPETSTEENDYVYGEVQDFGEDDKK